MADDASNEPTNRVRREPPPFRRVRVRSIEPLSPHMLRIVFGAQSELADLLLEDPAGVVDEQCIRDKTDELSDEDAEFLIDNFDASDTDAFGDELEAWIEGLLDCFTLAENEG